MILCFFVVSIAPKVDVTKIPSLTIHNLRNKPVHLRRKDIVTLINPSSDIEVESEDRVALVSGVFIEFVDVCVL